MKRSFQQQLSTSYLAGGNAAFIEDLYEQYLKDATLVPAEWRAYFQGLEAAEPRQAREVPHSQVREEFARMARRNGGAAPAAGAAGGLSPDAAEKQAAVLRLINAWRIRGH